MLGQVHPYLFLEAEVHNFTYIPFRWCQDLHDIIHNYPSKEHWFSTQFTIIWVMFTSTQGAFLCSLCFGWQHFSAFYSVAPLRWAAAVSFSRPLWWVAQFSLTILLWLNDSPQAFLPAGKIYQLCSLKAFQSWANLTVYKWMCNTFKYFCVATKYD